MQHWWGYALITALGPLKLFQANRYIYIGGKLFFLKKIIFGVEHVEQMEQISVSLGGVEKSCSTKSKKCSICSTPSHSKDFWKSIFVKFG